MSNAAPAREEFANDRGVNFMTVLADGGALGGDGKRFLP